MKVKTSITLSEDLLNQMDTLTFNYKNRSTLVEEAIRFFLEKIGKEQREKQDLAILNKNSTALNREAEDVLTYQVEL